MTPLTRLLARRTFRLPQFEVGALEFDQLAELMLQDPVHSSEPPSNVVSLSRATPTAGELRASIERHLQAKGGPAAALPDVSPAEELKNALAELRSSLR
jgi:hypothetical protein